MQPIVTRVARSVIHVCLAHHEPCKMAKPIRYRLGQTHLGHVSDEVHIGTTWRTRLNDLCAGRRGLTFFYFDGQKLPNFFLLAIEKETFSQCKAS